MPGVNDVVILGINHFIAFSNWLDQIWLHHSISGYSGESRHGLDYPASKRVREPSI